MLPFNFFSSHHGSFERHTLLTTAQMWFSRGCSSVLPPLLLVSLIACSSLHNLAEAARPPNDSNSNLKLDSNYRVRASHRKKNLDDVVADDAYAADDTATPAPAARPGAKDCVTHWITQDLDHFSWDSPAPGGVTSFKQRYLVHDAFWVPGGDIRSFHFV